MPAVLLAPVLSALGGFAAGWWAGDSFGWVKWLLVAAAVYYFAKQLGVI